MYHHLEGTIVEKSPTSLILDVRGVGYYLQTSLATFSDLPAIGSRLRLLTHFVVREDAHHLFGFLSEEERELFRMLVSVSGIGPKVALTALSGVPIPELKRAIAEGSVQVLTGISGIGKKTAERLIVELREKVVIEQRALAAKTPAAMNGNRIAEDSVQALVSLGYRKGQAQTAVDKVLTKQGSMASVEDLIRAALKNL